MGQSGRILNKDKGLVRIEAEIPKDVVLTQDDWFDKFGQPLIDFVTGKEKSYLCLSDRRHELDITPGFRDGYLKSVYQHMAKGKSYDSWGGRDFVSPARKVFFEKMIYEWRLVKEFGWLVCRERWEEIGIELADGTLEKGNASVYNATMKALFKESYGDSKEIKHEHTVGGKIEIKMLEWTGGPKLLTNEEYTSYEDVEQ